MTTYNITDALHTGRLHEVLAIPYAALAMFIFIGLAFGVARTSRMNPWIRWSARLVAAAVTIAGLMTIKTALHEDMRSLYVAGAFNEARIALSTAEMAQAFYWSDHHAYTTNQVALNTELDNQQSLDSRIQLQVSGEHYRANVRVPIEHESDQWMECERDEKVVHPACTIVWASGKRAPVVAE